LCWIVVVVADETTHGHVMLEYPVSQSLSCLGTSNVSPSKARCHLNLPSTIDLLGCKSLKACEEKSVWSIEKKKTHRENYRHVTRRNARPSVVLLGGRKKELGETFKRRSFAWWLLWRDGIYFAVVKSVGAWNVVRESAPQL